MSSGDLLYDDATIDFLEALWGDGYLSPGGPEEVARILSGLDLGSRVVLDIGCGSGGITVSLVATMGLRKVVGIDVEAPVCAKAQVRAEAAGLDDRIEIRQVLPGPLPLPDGSFDFVFSKDFDRPHPGQGSPGARGVPCAPAGRLVRRLGLADRP